MAIQEGSWVVDIEEERARALCRSAEEDLWKKASIYRVPAYVRDLNAKAFTPQVVSFGPYHHGSGHLKPMEEHKHRALLHFLNRAGRPLRDFMVDVRSVLQQLQGSYADLDDEWKRDGGEKFLKLMIVDGCFMLEILRCYDRRSSSSSSSADIESRSSRSSSSIGGEEDGYAPNDPLFSKHGVLHRMPYIRRDMLMLENQLPLLLLNTLHSVVLQSHHEVNKLVLAFVAPEDEEVREREHSITTASGGLHALDLLRQNMLRIPPGNKQFPLQLPWPQLQHRSASRIRSAAELHEAGVSFRRSGSSSLRDISFEGGVLTLPSIVVDDATEFTYLNLVALERLHVGAGNEVTSYVSLMDEIIDTAKDVALLHSSGIIDYGLASDQVMAELFNGLSREVTLDPRSGLDGVRWQVNSHCRKQCNKWRANLRHTYFRNPWSLLSLAAAILLLALTVAQTVYAVITYYHDYPSS